MSNPLEPENVAQIKFDFSEYMRTSRIAEPCPNKNCGYVGFTLIGHNDHTGLDRVKCNNCGDLTYIQNGKHVNPDAPKVPPIPTTVEDRARNIISKHERGLNDALPKSSNTA